VGRNSNARFVVGVPRIHVVIFGKHYSQDACPVTLPSFIVATSVVGVLNKLNVSLGQVFMLKTPAPFEIHELNALSVSTREFPGVSCIDTARIATVAGGRIEMFLN
jgi:hypothetical protein